MYYNGTPVSDGCWIWDPVAVGMLNSLCEIHGAKIVFNSSHNALGVDYLVEHCNFNGLKIEHIHQTIHTEFPLQTISRFGAISKWLTYNGVDVDCWIDDFKISTDNLVRVSFNNGITFEKYEKANILLRGASQVQIPSTLPD
jgi:hypothetical protein